MKPPPGPTRLRRRYLVAAAFVACLYLVNTSLLADLGETGPLLVAHRAVSQQYDRDGLTGETCTAARTILTGHDYLENTLPAIGAAFDFGADIVEIDVHPTTDYRFAIFHDWSVDCRTNGSGVTRRHSLDSLKALDVGYGYTADGGNSFPFRGRAVGMIPSLDEVLAAYPDGRFIIDVKSQDPDEGHLLASRLSEVSLEERKRLMVYGGGVPVGIIREQLPDIRTIWPRRLRQCLLRYAAVGWTGYVPADCRESVIMVPANYAPWVWGWPNRFVQRMEREGSVVFMIGDYAGEGHTQGFDDPGKLRDLPADFSAGIWTDRIDLIGPALAR